MKHFSALLPLIFAIATTTLVGCGGSDKKPKPQPVNTIPTASAASFNTQTDTQLTGMLTAMDADGDALVYSAASQPSSGTLTLAANGSFTYLPDATVTGSDQFTFSVSDGKQTSSIATVSITIETLQVSFSVYSRSAYAQMPTDEPLPVNGREFAQDVSEETAYDDLLQ